MIITGGTLRGRNLLSPQGTDIRPSGARTREALFNILAHTSPPAFAGQHVADICCGSGLLGFEALSRGAAEITFVDASRTSLDLARANADRLGVRKQCHFLQADAAKLPTAPAPYAAVLADPPYHQGLGAPLLKGLVEGGWLRQGSYVTLETDSKETLPEHPGLTLLKDRAYGKARLAIFQYTYT